MIRPLPGDIFHTRGSGFVGGLIRTGTQSSIAHNGIFIKELGPCPSGGAVWLTHEAFGSKGPEGRSGVRQRFRCTGECEEYLEPVTVAKNDSQRALMVKRSYEILAACTGYDWIQVIRSGLQSLIRVSQALKLKPVELALKGLRSWLVRFSAPTAYFCTEHVMECIIAGRPELEARMKYTSNEYLPGAAAEFTHMVGRENEEEARLLAA